MEGKCQMYTEYRNGKPCAYRYGEPWVATQLYVEGGFKTEEEAIRQWDLYCVRNRAKKSEEILSQIRIFKLAHPELRIGQILCIAAGGDPFFGDPFYMEDADLMERLKELNEE